LLRLTKVIRMVILVWVLQMEETFSVIFRKKKWSGPQVYQNNLTIRNLFMSVMGLRFPNALESGIGKMNVR